MVGTTTTDRTSSSGFDLGWFFEPRTGETTRIGYSTLEDPPNRTNDRLSLPQDNGFTAGTSKANASGAPHQAWAVDPDESIAREIGLPDSTDLGSDSRLISQTVKAVTPANLVVGTSFRNPTPSGTFHGQAVWVYRPDDLSTERVGLFDPTHTHDDGQTISKFDDVNGNGLVAGRSEFPTDSFPSEGAWVYDPATGVTTAIGLANPAAGAEYRDFFTAISDQDFVLGGSMDQVGSDTPWIYDHSTQITKTLGLFDAEHTHSDNRTENEIVDYAETRFVLGEAERGIGDTRSTFNVTPWIFDPDTPNFQRAGLIEGGYTTPDGGRWASAIQINDSGQAIGFSRLFAGGPSSIERDSPWFFDPVSGETIELARNLSNERDTVFLGPLLLNNHGQVAGISKNVFGGGDYVWFYDRETGETVVDFDVRDEFTFRPTGGGAEVSILDLTKSGLVLGSSARHQANGADAGSTLWLYDSVLDTTHELIFSMDNSGNAFTNVEYLSEAGVIFGEYDAYDASAQIAGRRYFYWSLEHGFHDLESLIVGDLARHGWDSIVHSFEFQGDLKIVDERFLSGRGLRTNGSYLPFALVQIPEPSTGCLFVLAALLLLTCGRRTML